MSSASAIPDHLIHTKLYPPRVPERLVNRERLIDRLNKGRKRPLTLISASAGYGKSTLAHQWLKANTDPFAWLSLDEYDSDLNSLLDYLIAALSTVFPEIGQETKNLLKRPQLPAPERLADGLLHDLRALSRPVFLVVDDYHTVINNDAHSFMSRFLDLLPPELHLVLISRSVPPLNLTQLRGQGQIQEIRGSDLHFTPQEAGTLLQLILGEPIDLETVNLLVERTEGWPAGLRMAAMSLQAAEDRDEFKLRYASGGHKPATDYLLSELLDRLPDEQRLLMLRTSVLNRFCSPLIEVLAMQSMSEISGYDFVERLWSSNFFLIALDVQGTWYRYHQLFRQLLSQQLQQELSEEEVAAIHSAASLWFEDAGFIEEAITHAIKARESGRAAKIVEEHVHRPINQEDWRLVERWIKLLPEEARRRPGLLATQAMLDQIRYRVASMLPMLDAAEEGLQSHEYDYTSEQEKAWMGVINTYRSVSWYPFTTPQDSLRYAEKALEQVDPSAKYVYSIAVFWQVHSLQQAGDAKGAIHLGKTFLANQVGPPDVLTNRLMLALGATYHAEADVHGLRNHTIASLDIAQRTGQPISVAWAYYLRGWSFYQENRLEEAHYHFSKVLEMRTDAHARAVVDCMTGLSLIQGFRGELQETRNTLETLREFIVDQSALPMLPLVDSLALRLGLEGNMSGSVPDFVMHLRAQLAADLWELPVLTACWMGINKGGAQDLAAAKNTLIQCQEFALSRNNKRQLLQIGTLLALCHDACGEREPAFEALQAAVLLGEPGGALRYFTDLGPDLVPLLRTLHEQGTAPDYIEQILSVFGESGPTRRAATVITELTNREMEVLQLLGKRFTDKEITAELHISPRTVSSHTIGLYRKLEVNGRRQAVARALELGLLNNYD